MTTARCTRELPLQIDLPDGTLAVQPVTFGVSLPRGQLADTTALSLLDGEGRATPLQTKVLEKWSDGMVAWLLVDTLLDPRRLGNKDWKLTWGEGSCDLCEGTLVVDEEEDRFLVRTGDCELIIDRWQFGRIEAYIDGKQILEPDGGYLRLTDQSESMPLILRSSIETLGSVRTTLRFDGEFPARPNLRFTGRLSFFTGTTLIKVGIKVHNAGRAYHPGGLWDLGDRGSIHFRDLSLDVTLAGEGPWQTTWITDSKSTPQSSSDGVFEIYQANSGGENWSSDNHVNRDGIVPFSFRGYSLRHGPGPIFQRGDRAQPIVHVQGASSGLAVAVPEFWEQFPKSIAVHDNAVKLGIFAGLADGAHALAATGAPAAAQPVTPMGYSTELQGGEQKGQTLWLELCDGSGDPSSLCWVHQPALVTAKTQSWIESGAVPYLPSVEAGRSTPLADYLASVPGILAEKRETIDEYGWRNFGDIFADHEATYYTGQLPLVSHYNNQYDQVLGLLLQYLRTGDRRWWSFADPLARHVIDIDIYHTLEDKAGYSGGMHWFTDHYLHAYTSTHRTYSKKNAPANGTYGGGPSSMHVFSSGLLLYYRLTGDPEARDAVLELAHWLMRAEDSRFHPLGFLDESPTGTTTGARGPHRAGGNTINTVLDAWQLTRDRKYLEHVEAIIRRSIHPDDDIAARDLLDIENRWSYTVYLTALYRYLSVKAELGELDDRYAYARAALQAYGRWMLAHEIPYFDQEERLEYPTESWGGQELRKANVLRYAASLEQEPIRTQMREKADRLGERGWHDLIRFETRYVARAIALALVEGTRDAFLRIHGAPELPPPRTVPDFGEPSRFVGIKQRVQARIRRPVEWPKMVRVFIRRLPLLFHRPENICAAAE